MNPRQFLADLARFPWVPTLATLRERFREDRLGLTASSLTFTTTIALVPFFTVALAIFTAFPIFGKLQANLQAWLVQSLVPEAISRQVLGYLTQFAGKASRLGGVGLAALVVSATALVLTIDRTLNNIWRVRRPRPLGQRVMIYWATLTLGPLLLAASLGTTSYVISAGRGLVTRLPGTLGLLIDLVEFALLVGAFMALYRYVPNTPVKRPHALAGGLFAAVGLELAKRMLAWYIAKVPTYSMVYGAFATVPILLVWIYITWVIVLLGAVIAAYLPALLAGPRRLPGGHGWQFQLALEVLALLKRAGPTARHGLTATELGARMQVDVLQLEPVLQALVQLDWIGRLNELEDQDGTRYVMLADVRSTSLEPLMRALLLPVNVATAKMWESGRLSSLYLSDVL
ncbi:MAG: YihY family inner membrane protein [Burkholderiales bacterium]|nr:YihY family inner membrane protein [Burkholderiales bacterium]